MFDPPGRYDFTIIASQTWNTPFYLTTDTAGASALNLTGYTGVLQIGPPANITLTTPSGGLFITPGASGIVTPLLTPAQTGAVPATPRVQWSLYLTDTNGNGGYPLLGAINWTTALPTVT